MACAPAPADTQNAANNVSSEHAETRLPQLDAAGTGAATVAFEVETFRQIQSNTDNPVDANKSGAVHDVKTQPASKDEYAMPISARGGEATKSSTRDIIGIVADIAQTHVVVKTTPMATTSPTLFNISLTFTSCKFSDSHSALLSTRLGVPNGDLSAATVSPTSSFCSSLPGVARRGAATDNGQSSLTLSAAVQPASMALAAAASQTSQGSQGSLKSDLGPLLGGLLGGFFGLIIMVVAIWAVWHWRHTIFRRRETAERMPSSPMHDYKHAERPAGQHQAASPPVPTPAPQPYQYGVVGRPLPAGTTANVPHTPDPSRSHSPSVLTSYSPPPSASFRTSITPLPGARTAITPGPSIASSSRASTPGLVPAYPSQLQQYHHELQQQQYQQQYQSQQARLSWPRYGGSEDGYDERRSPAQRARSERRPSRLSLTLANWNPETDGELGDIGVQEIDSSGGPTEVTVEETSQTGWSQSAASSAGDVQRRADSGSAGPPEAPSNAPT